MQKQAEDLKAKVKLEVDRYELSNDPKDLTLIKDPKIAKGYSKMNMNEFIANICNVNGTRLLLVESPIIKDKPNFTQFILDGLNNGGVVDSKENGRFFNANYYALLNPYFKDTGYKPYVYDSTDFIDQGKFKPELLVQKFLESDQRIAMLRTNNHMYAVAKVPDPNNPGKFKVVKYDPAHTDETGLEWNHENASNKNPMEMLILVPDPPKTLKDK